MVHHPAWCDLVRFCDAERCGSRQIWPNCEFVFPSARVDRASFVCCTAPAALLWSAWTGVDPSEAPVAVFEGVNDSQSNATASSTAVPSAVPSPALPPAAAAASNGKTLSAASAPERQAPCRSRSRPRLLRALSQQAPLLGGYGTKEHLRKSTSTWQLYGPNLSYPDGIAPARLPSPGPGLYPPRGQHRSLCQTVQRRHEAGAQTADDGGRSGHCHADAWFGLTGCRGDRRKPRPQAITLADRACIWSSQQSGENVGEQRLHTLRSCQLSRCSERRWPARCLLGRERPGVCCRIAPCAAAAALPAAARRQRLVSTLLRSRPQRQRSWLPRLLVLLARTCRRSSRCRWPLTELPSRLQLRCPCTVRSKSLSCLHFAVFRGMPPAVLAALSQHQAYKWQQEAQFQLEQRRLDGSRAQDLHLQATLAASYAGMPMVMSGRF
jgi:hypothetical protein